ncbi:transposase [Bacillus cereus]|uniref:transposase n=1 Tax=Bacillus cereus TaxID=1396 RepID=UPI00211192D4|nr:transposase [Bacillus cereus]
MGIDDFAFLKRVSYGCIICDLSTHRPIDMLKDRDQQTVTNWLKKHPSIQIVTRDGSLTFRRAIQEANPAIVQISDRFHIIQSLRKCINTSLDSLLSAQIEIHSACQHQVQDPRIRIKRQQKRLTDKWQLAQKMQHLYKQGLSIQKISKNFQMDWRTVKKYINMSSPPDSTQGYRDSPIDAYMETIQTSIQAGNTVKEIYKQIQKLGYEGKYGTVRIRIEDYRRQLKQQTVKHQNTYISRKKYKKLFMLPKNRLSEEENKILFRIIQKNPVLKDLYNFYHSFLTFFTAKKIQDLKQLIANEISGSFKPIQEYCKRLYQDIDAIINGCVYTFSNGLLEGQVNRLKTIKRMIYGRGSAELLRIRVLYNSAHR